MINLKLIFALLDLFIPLHAVPSLPNHSEFITVASFTFNKLLNQIVQFVCEPVKYFYELNWIIESLVNLQKSLVALLLAFAISDIMEHLQHGARIFVEFVKLEELVVRGSHIYPVVYLGKLNHPTLIGIHKLRVVKAEVDYDAIGDVEVGDPFLARVQPKLVQSVHKVLLSQERRFISYLFVSPEVPSFM